MYQVKSLDGYDIKHLDNDTLIRLQLFNNYSLIKYDGKFTAKIKNDTGYIKSFETAVIENSICFTTANFFNLPPGNYFLEIWQTLDDNKQIIYPSDGFVKFTVNSNVEEITGNVINTISLADFQKQFNELKRTIEEKSKILVQGSKGDSAYQIAQKHGFNGSEAEFVKSLWSEFKVMDNGDMFQTINYDALI